jgi:hypothetical protein
MPVKYSEKKPSSTGPSTFEIAMTLEKWPLITASLAEILRPCRQRRRDDRLVETGNEHCKNAAEQDRDEIYITVDWVRSAIPACGSR